MIAGVDELRDFWYARHPTLTVKLSLVSDALSSLPVETLPGQGVGQDQDTLS